MIRERRSGNRMQHALAALALLLGCFSQGYLNAETIQDYVVRVEASAAASPPSITLSWPLESRATGYTVQRKLYTSTTVWDTVASLPGTATGWTDTTVAVGTQYEYQISRPSTIGSSFGLVTGSGTISAGIQIPVVDHRGTIILIVDTTMATSLASELTRLRDDLVGDGWSVIRHDVSRTAPVTTIKALIKADYDAAPTEVKSVLLFGHIPVPRSGADSGGGHAPEHFGAFPADVFYGEMNGVWTDTTVNWIVATSPWTECWNIPGDGKFDQTRPPTRVVELEVGRVDLWGLPAFAPRTETDLLRRYLNKDHEHRHAIRVLPRRAMISDEAGVVSGNA